MELCACLGGVCALARVGERGRSAVRLSVVDDVSAPSLSPAAQHCAGLCLPPARTLSRRAALACGENMLCTIVPKFCRRVSERVSAGGRGGPEKVVCVESKSTQNTHADLAQNGVCSTRQPKISCCNTPLPQNGQQRAVRGRCHRLKYRPPSAVTPNNLSRCWRRVCVHPLDPRRRQRNH